ncbi:unnamed protein product, partial [Brenthis ino]
MSSGCNVCKLNVLITQKRINCVKCQAKYHFECIVPPGSSKSPIIRGQWVCPICKNKSPPTLLESSIAGTTKTTEETVAPEGNWLTAIRNEVQKIISQTVSVELTKIREELTGLHDIQSSIEYLSSIFDTVKQELEDAKKEILSLKKDNSDLRDIVNSHANIINILDREARANNIEVHCIPEHKGENLLKTVEQIGRVINTPITEGSVVKCTRVAKLNKISTRLIRGKQTVKMFGLM